MGSKRKRPTSNANNCNKVSKTNSKTQKLINNPIVVKSNEFEELTTFEELDNFKFMGMRKSGQPYTQNWSKESGKRAKLSQPVIMTGHEIEEPMKTTLRGKEVIISNGEDNSTADKPKKKKRNKQPQVKASYDKTTEELQKISNSAKDKDSGIDSPVQKSVPPPRLNVDMSAWDKLHVPERIKDALSELGFSRPTKIQELTIAPAIKEGLDILGAAETGSGKTLAFGIPIIAGILRDRIRKKKKQEKKDAIEQLRQKTIQIKEKRTETIFSDEDADSESDNENDESDYQETDDSDVEEYLFNGPDGVLEINYDDLKNEENSKDVEDSDEEVKTHSRKVKKHKSSLKKNNKKIVSTIESDNEDEINSDDDEIDMDDQDLLNSDEIDAEEDDDEIDPMDDDEINSDDVFDMDKENSNDSDGEDEIDLDEENEIYSDEEIDMDKANYNDSDEDAIDSDSDNDLIDSDDSDDDRDLGSDDEQDVDSDQSDDQKQGCIRAINNVVFPFVEQKKRFVDEGDSTLLRALILTPTRELAIQIHKHLSQLCSHASVKCCVIVGGLDARKQKRILVRSRPEIVIATPGRLYELIQDGLDHVSELRGVRYLAIDEADRMIDRKNFEEVHKIVRLMSDGSGTNSRSSNRQTFVFSATLSMVHKLPDRMQTKHKTVEGLTSESKLQKLAKMIGSKPSAKIVDVTRQHATAENLTECRINCEMGEKDYYLYYFLQRHPGRTMVFCNSIEAVRRLRSVFSMMNCNPLDLHASLHQKQRLRNLQQFTDSPNGLLITTDVAARGLDIHGVQHVIHFQVPFTAESYVHRSGRTARGTHSGLSVVFVEPKDVLRFRSICNTLGRTNVKEIPAFPVDENLYDQVLERVDLAIKLEKMQHKNKMEEQLRHEKKRVADQIGVTNHDEEIDQEDLKLMPSSFQREYRSGGNKAEFKHMRIKLDSMLCMPLLGAMFSYSHPMNKAALAASMGTDASSIPDELVGLNPTKSMFEDDADAAYRERYAKEIYGEVPQKSENIDACTILKKQRKDMAKLTKNLLKPEESAREISKRMKAKKIDIQKKKSAKKREKRRKKRTQSKS